MVVDEGWSRLPVHWCGAFRQAWAAYVAGTIPVGAVVVDPNGVITAARYREPPWRPLIETTGAILARGREQGETVEEVVPTIWATIQQVQVHTASDTASEAR